MLWNCYQCQQTRKYGQLLHQIGPVTAMMVGLTILALRAPYRRFAYYEAPLWLLSVLLVSLGAFCFVPEKEDFQWSFQLLLGGMGALYTAFGLFCTAVDDKSPLRAGVIEPTKRAVHFGLPGLEVGYLFGPFFFPYYLWRHYYQGAGTSPEYREPLPKSGT